MTIGIYGQMTEAFGADPSKADTGLATGTSVQVGLAGLGKETAQVSMLQEFGTAPGTGGKKETLVDVEKEKAKEKAKPLPGQIELTSRIKTPTKEGTVKRATIKKAVEKAPPIRAKTDVSMNGASAEGKRA